MKIIILGAGQVGGTLAEHLASEANDITEAIEMLQAGSVRDAIQVLQGSLDRRNRTREQRKGKTNEQV